MADSNRGRPRPKAAGIVLAGGAGQRFGGPKFRVSFLGQRLVDRAVSLLVEVCRPVIVVLPAGEVWDGDPRIEPVTGGGDRGESLMAGLAQIGDRAEISVIHDVIRPLATLEQVVAVIDAVDSTEPDGQAPDGAVTAWTPPDTIKRYNPADSSLTHVGRDDLLIIQGPSAVRVGTVNTAAAHLGSLGVEEMVAIEQIGGRIVVLPGDPWSHHIVTPQDLKLAEQVAIVRDDRPGRTQATA